MSVHLMVRSAYTLLKSSLRVEDIVNEAVRQGYDAVALSDYEVMHGAMAFYHACQKQGIKGIYGMEVHCVLSPGEQAVFVVLARNDEGFLQLMKLSTRLQTQKEELTIEELAAYAADCIVITSGAEDVLYALLVREDEAGLRRYLQQLQRTFTHLAVGITRNDSRFLAQRNQLLRKAADEMGITRVALAIICYRSAADEEAYRVLCAIDQGLQVDDKTLKTASGRWFRSKAEMAQLYEQKELEASDAIAARCNVEMAFPRAHLPVYENRYGVSSVQFLNTLCKKGLAKRIGSSRVPKAYVQRLQYELEVINSMGFTDYFLIVWDFIRYARSQKIFIGPGRGSAAGSLVSYCLGITHIDPIHYDLLFERFLNPKRVSMPDIDTDFPDDRRQEVIDYVHERYGAHHVAHIITFNTLGAKQVLRDAGKALGILPRQIDALCRMIPNMPKVTLQQAMDKAKQSGLPEDAQAARDLADQCERFEKKLYDLELTRNISLQMGPQIRLLQNNNTMMAEKIQSTIVNTIPLWKNQMVLALGLAHTQKAMQAERAVTDMTNDLLKKNADALKMGTIETAKESQRGVVDIETLQQTNKSLIETLDELNKIQTEGRAKRVAAEQELTRIEDELKQKMMEIRS